MKNYIRDLGIAVIVGFIGMLIIGMKIFYPYHVHVTIGLYSVGWIVFVIDLIRGKRLKGLDHVKKKILIKLYSKRQIVVVFLVLLAVGYFLYVIIPVDGYELNKDSELLSEEIKNDSVSLEILEDNVLYSLEKFEEISKFVKDGAGLDLESRNYIKTVWADYLLYGSNLDFLSYKYSHFYQIDYLDKRELHEEAFLIGFNSLLLEYSSILTLVSFFDGNTYVEGLLNEEGAGVLTDSYYNLKKVISNPENIILINTWTAYYELLKDSGIANCSTYCDRIEKNLRGIQSDFELAAKIVAEDPLKTFEKETARRWFPIQKHVAIIMSEIKDPEHNYGISFSFAKKILNNSILQPGDILLERREGHLTNIGIPGFWKHAALYVGTRDELDFFFEDVISNASLALMESYASVVTNWSFVDDLGFDKRVIEAVKQGVVLQSFEKSVNADHLIVLRPKISKLDLFEAINKSFFYFGVPYDYDFDFSSDNYLICSELIYKAYEELLSFDLQLVSGREMLKPQGIYDKFEREYSSDLELDFVYLVNSVNGSLSEGLVEDLFV